VRTAILLSRGPAPPAVTLRAVVATGMHVSPDVTLGARVSRVHRKATHGAVTDPGTGRPLRQRAISTVSPVAAIIRNGPGGFERHKPDGFAGVMLFVPRA
jgi:hypothetical protein